MPQSNIAYENLRAEMSRKKVRILDIAKTLEKQRLTVGDKLARKRPLSLIEAFKIQSTFFPEFTLIYLFHEDNLKK